MSGAGLCRRASGSPLKRATRRALTKPTQTRRLRRATARITGRDAPLEPLPMSSDSHPRPGSMTQLARA
ncbi:hypothetical protein XbrCFBP1976_04725 [Xanthomonas bromi]|uniref:Uncharacterized protein n=1 Tax=Xanthomonas bromi TaxID=56449 RepID=A0ABX5BUY2_9XANT|nr:hypothetical protein XbrCFBP1976_04725 [Xanthomonas bromi]